MHFKPPKPQSDSIAGKTPLTSGIRPICLVSGGTTTCEGRFAVNKLIDEIGHKYGFLTVVARAPNNSTGRAMWHCQCSCGKTTTVVGKDLRSGHTKSCGHTRTIPRIGETYGRLTVIEEAERASNGRRQWRCICECGQETVTKGIYLRQGDTRSCGCLQREISRRNMLNMSKKARRKGIEKAKKILTEMRACGWKHPRELLDGESARNSIFRIYQWQAAHRRNSDEELEWTLTKEEFTKLTSSPCHYCGVPPSNLSTVGNSKYSYNGLDRKDNDEGYTPDNVVPCCWECNNKKRTTHYDEFLDWIKRIHDHMQLGRSPWTRT